MTGSFIVDDDTVAHIEAGVKMIDWARSGKSKEFMWHELGKMGFKEKERVEIARTVNGFMQHKKGNHEDCPPMCNQVENLANETRNKSIQDIADNISKRHELHESSTFSDEILDEWK
jgi:hypothetical protein